MQYEAEVAEALGLSVVPGSGNQWHSRSDASGKLRVSCKSTAKRSWSETKRQLAEAIDLAQGTGEVPALAIEEPETGERILIMRLSDAAQILTEDAPTQRKPSRAEAVRDLSRVPVLLREGNDD